MRFVALVLTVLLLAGCKDRYQWYQTTTVTIDTPDGPVSGQGIVGVKLKVIQRQTISGGFLSWNYGGKGRLLT